jgi:hypothetical protein
MALPLDAAVGDRIVRNWQKAWRRSAIAGVIGAEILGAASAARAGAFSPPTTIVSVRTYDTGSNSTSAVMITVSGWASFCSGATSYSISLLDAAGQGMLAEVITAVTTGKSVVMELSNVTGCTTEFNWGPQLQSLWLNNQ